MAEKQLEKIKKIWAKGQLEKAWQLAEEALRQGIESPELDSLSFGLCLALHNWTEVLTRIKKHYKEGYLTTLCGGENRQAFVEFVREHPGFRSGLSDYFCSIHAYQGIADWVHLSDDYDQRWLAENWINSADQVAVPAKKGALYVAAGLCHAIRKEPDDAWRLWIQAVGADLSLLPKIMAFLQDSRLLDMKLIHNRMQIIRMLLVAGRRKEALQLLLVMGCEKEDNALKVLLAIPELFPGDSTLAVIELRFSLAIYLKDPEILANVIGDMASLSEDHLFQFKKQAVLKIEEPALQRQIILYFCKVYMQRDNWESAALILEGLFIESPTDDVVTLMGEVLDHYPMLPEMNLVVGQYYLENGHVDKALKYWGTIKESPEFRPKIKRSLEQRLIEGFDPACAFMLFDMSKMGSNRAGLLAFWIMKSQDQVDQRFLGRMEHGLLRAETHPMWLYALMYGFTRAQNYPLVQENLEHFLTQFPDLSAEVLGFAETLVDQYPSDFLSLRRFLSHAAPKLVPAQSWIRLSAVLLQKAKAYATGNSGPQPLRTRAIEQPSEANDLSKDGEYSVYFESFQERVLTRNWSGAAALATKAAEQKPAWRNSILQQTEQLRENQPKLWDWAKLHFQLLMLTAQYEELEKHLGDAIREEAFKDNLPWLYQMLGETEKKLGKHREALSAFVLASAEETNYQKNRHQLPDLVKQAGGQQFRDVLNLIHHASDEAVWQRMVRIWHEERPEDLELIVSMQKGFADRVNTSQSYMDLSYWSLQAGKEQEYKDALGKVDLRDISSSEPLEHLVDLANLKYPESVTAKFTLGRYYTIQREIPRAVDTFRNLVASAPNHAEAVYHYLRSYLTNQPDCPDRVHLYGLLIRIALDHKLNVPAVRLLDEFGQLDLESAQGLSQGVNRVLLQDKEANCEALLIYGSLLKKWGAFERLLQLEEDADFGTEMVTERLEWFAAMKAMPAIRAKACLCRARIFATKKDFEACREELAAIDSDDVRAQAAELYNLLCSRYPNNWDLQHEAAWVFERAKHPNSLIQWQKLFQSEEATGNQLLEAYAALKEAHQSPDMNVLKQAFEGQQNHILGGLRDVYVRRRELELEVATLKDEPPAERVLSYLLESNQLERFAAWFAKADGLDEETRLQLDIRHMQRQGFVVQAAMRAAFSPLQCEFRQSVLRDAGLFELAAAANDVGERLTPALRAEFAKHFKKPKVILARYDFMVRNKREQARRQVQTVMVKS